MASYYKIGNGWRAQVQRAGVRDSAVRDTKAEAVAWATKREAEILAGARGQVIHRRLVQALQRYSEEVSPTKDGCRWEQIRLAKFERQFSFVGKMLSDISASDISSWRDSAIAGGLAQSTVRREMILLHSVLESCRRDWGWLLKNPMEDVAYPPHGKARNRRVSSKEYSAIIKQLGWDGRSMASTISQRVAVCWALGLETGMRAGEMTTLTRDQIHLREKRIHLEKTKNGDERDVPLSRGAIELLSRFPHSGDLPPSEELVVGVSASSRDTLFRKARDAAMVANMHFHDSRHEATTRLARHLDILDLAAMIGHRDLKSLQVYYNPTAKEIAGRIDGSESGRIQPKTGCVHPKTGRIQPKKSR